jgi:hypothetical protein
VLSAAGGLKGPLLGIDFHLNVGGWKKDVSNYYESDLKKTYLWTKK